MAEGLIRLLRAAVAPALLVLLAGCDVWHFPGDPGISLYAWNRSNDSYILRVGTSAQQCYLVDPGSLGKFYGDIGRVRDLSESITLHTMDGDVITNIHPVDQAMMYVIGNGHRIDEHTLRFEAGLPDWAERSIMDIPAVPELHGQQSPELFPVAEDDMCTSDPAARTDELTTQSATRARHRGGTGSRHPLSTSYELVLGPPRLPPLRDPRNDSGL